MKYFLDTEFIEGTQKNWRIKTKKPTIDLISIGIVSEDNREYYAISKDFNLKEAWNRWQQRTGQGDRNNHEPKEYWIRENVLKTIFIDFLKLQAEYLIKQRRITGYAPPLDTQFTYSNFKKLLNRFGKSNKEIAKKVLLFVNDGYCKEETTRLQAEESYSLYKAIEFVKGKTEVEFYAYYAAYDWVVFCWLFGKMIDLPKGFPMFSRDLKVMLDDKLSKSSNYGYLKGTLEDNLKLIKKRLDYPVQNNCHNALNDARWNLALFNFINRL
tara:strand:+ start:10324 stop:11130 length:807 start_codon:yes stop_codon:yes gene_type:complete